LVFPEGTRSFAPEMLPFKKGAFHLAIKTQRPILPFVVSDISRVVDSQRKVIQPGVIRVRCKLSNLFEIHDIIMTIFIDMIPIPTLGLEAKDVDMLMEKTRGLMVHELKSINAPETQ
jgi:lysophosphatidate acyltransferase